MSVEHAFESKDGLVILAPMTLQAYSAHIVAAVLTQSHSHSCCLMNVCHTWGAQEFHAGHDNH